jgi:hypothetical protein
LCAQLRRPQRDMYPGVAVGRGRPWAFPLAFSTFGLYVGLLVGIFTGDLLFTLTTAFVGAFLGAALYARAGTAYHRLAVLQRALGPDHYRFYVSMEWPIDGLLQFVLDRLVARGLMVFPIAPGFVGIPKEAIARLRYGYVIGPLDRQLLVLQTMEAVLHHRRAAVQAGDAPRRGPGRAHGGAAPLGVRAAEVAQGIPAHRAHEVAGPPLAVRRTWHAWPGSPGPRGAAFTRRRRCDPAGCRPRR